MIDFSKLTAEWLTKNFQEITDDISNGDYIEDVSFETNITSEYIRETNSVKETEDGITINFRVWFNSWGDFMTERGLSYLTITNNGEISIRLPEAIEFGGIEDELKKRIKELLDIKQEEQEEKETKCLIPTKYILDRDRHMNYNGRNIIANSYRCSSCDEDYIMEISPASYCPYCGVKFEEIEDISI